MQRTVYVDVLLSVNLLVDYFLLLWVNRYFALQAGRLRILAGAAAGASGSLLILLPDLPEWVLIPLNLLLCFGMVSAAFAPQRMRQLLKLAACTYGISFAYAGAMVAARTFLSPDGLLIRNSVVYLHVSPLFLASFTVALYGLFRLMERITGKKEPSEHSFRVQVVYRGKSVKLLGKLDTGNALKEPFSGDPVIVAEETALLALGEIPEEEMRIIPYRLLSGEGFLAAFRPGEVYLLQNRKRITAPPCYIARFDGRLEAGAYNALIHPLITNMGKEELL